MDTLVQTEPTAAGARTVRCHLWCWAGAAVEWEQHRLVIGGLSPLGLMMAALTASASSVGNRRRREEAIRRAAPRWRYVATGTAYLANGWVTVIDEAAVTRTFDLRPPVRVEQPAPDWLRIGPPDGTTTGGHWAINLKW